MELISLSCNNCGAKLKVGEDTRFVTCKHCEAQLAVRHEDGAAFTDVLEAALRVEKSAVAIEAHVAELGADNDRLFLQGEIARLDREWDARREGMLTRSQDGTTHAPARIPPVAIGVLAVLCFAPISIPAFLGVDLPFSGIFWALSVAMAVGTVFGLAQSNQRADRYQRALADHDAEREELVARLESLGQEHTPAPRRKRRRDAD